MTNLFGENEGETVADFRNKTVMLLADVLNDRRVNRLKQVLALYNKRAEDSANGQMDIFSGGVKSKEEIIKEVNELLGNATKEEKQRLIDAASEERKRRASEEGSRGLQIPSNGESEGAEPTGPAVRSSEGDGIVGEEGSEEPGKPGTAGTGKAAAEPRHTGETGGEAEAGGTGETGAEADTGNAAVEVERISDELDAAEQKWEDKIRDYVYEHYPTQATVTSETNSARGRKEREAMKNDPVLKEMHSQRKEELDAIDERLGEAMRRAEEPEQGGVREQRGERGGHRAAARNRSSDEKELMAGVNDWLRDAGFEVIDDIEEGQRELDETRELEELLQMSKRKPASETAIAQSSEEERHNTTDISDADGAKLLKDIENLAKKYEEKSNRPRTFLQDVAEAIGAKEYGTKSKYVTIKAKNGRVVTIRLANHNTTVSQFDYRGEEEGVSIVVSKHSNEGVTNDGEAHVVEFFYSEQALRKADGKPLVQIIRSVEQLLYSGEYKDTTGLAVPQEVNERTLRHHRGDGLRVGGEGMKGFYDQMLPRWMDKYGRKWGVKTGEVEIPGVSEGNENEALGGGDAAVVQQRTGRGGARGLKMWGVDVTPEMRESVMAGQPMFFRTASGEVYGYTKDGKIYIDPRVATAETPVHEYVHLWAEALRKANPAAWVRLSEQVLGQEDVLAYVRRLYPELEGDELVEEVFAHFAGKRGAERLMAERDRMMREADGVFEKSKVAMLFDKIARALKDFWELSKELFAGRVDGVENLSAEDFADMALADLARRVDRGRGLQIPSNGAARNRSSEKAVREQRGGEPITDEEVFDKAKERFGTTEDFGEAGYILPDGTMLDFSGRHQVDEGQDTSHLRGGRHVDHRDIKQLNYEKDGNTETGMNVSMEDFIGRGAIRIADNAGSINLSQKPTPKQARTLRRYIQHNDGYVTVEIGNGYDSEHYGEYDEGTKATKVMGDIDRYFDEGILFRDDEEDIEEVNKRFNEELKDFTLETADKFIFSLGMPSDVLLAAGVENKPIRLYGSKIAAKMKKHGFDAQELQNLPYAVAHPIAVFDNLSKRGNRSVLTELNTDDGNFLVTIDLGKGSDVDFDIVSSVFGKRGSSVVEWINKGYLKYVDKEKALNYLHLSAPIAEASENPGLNSAANIIKDFENPNISEKKNTDDNGISQGFGSAGTSLNQVPRGMRLINWQSGTRNVDIGGGRFDAATDYLSEQGVENLVFDPFNRDVEHNKEVAERVRDEKADTATCHNVLNVIDTAAARGNVILQAAKAIKPDGTAYFTVYEGDKSGKGRQTKSDSWQNNRPTKDYVKEIEKYFDDVTVKNNMIIARSPKQTAEQSVWDFDGAYSGNGIAFRSGEERAEDNRREVSRGEWLGLVNRRMELARRMDEVDDRIKETGRLIRKEKYGSDEWNRLFDERTDLINEKDSVEEEHAAMVKELQGIRPRRSAAERRQRERLARREFGRARGLASEWAEKMHLGGRVDVYDSIDDVPGSKDFAERRRNAKGWYDPSTGKIAIVIGNHRSVDDVLRTVLHEAVGHHGLRELFGSHFDTFLDNVWENCDLDIRMEIMAKAGDLMRKDKGKSADYYRRLATEEYLAGLAESDEMRNAINGTSEEVGVRNYYNWWGKIREQFVKMLRALGLPGLKENVPLNNNELLYVLWRSYKNLSEPGVYRNPFQVAEDVAMQTRLGVGIGERADRTRSSVRTMGDRESERRRTLYVENDKPIPEYIKKWVRMSKAPGLTFEENNGIVEALGKAKAQNPRAIEMFKTRVGYVLVNKDRKLLASALGMENQDYPYMVISEDDIDLVLPSLVSNGHVIGIVDLTENMAREGAGEVRFVGEEENSEERERRVKERLAALKEKYGGKDFSYVRFDMNPRELLKILGFTEEELEGETEATLKEFMEDFKENYKRTHAVYSQRTRKIVIFADKLKVEKAEEHFFHENIHGILHDWYGDDLRGIAERFWEIAPDKGKVKRDFVKKEYEEKDWKEELFVFWLSRSMRDGDVDSIIDMLQDEGDKNRVERILKLLNYGKRKETEERKASGDNGRTDELEREFGRLRLEFGRESGESERASGEYGDGLRFREDDEEENLEDAEDTAEDAEDTAEVAEEPVEGVTAAEVREAVENAETTSETAETTSETAVPRRRDLNEIATEKIIELVRQNRGRADVRLTAMRQIGGNLQKLRQAMAVQRRGAMLPMSPRVVAHRVGWEIYRHKKTRSWPKPLTGLMKGGVVPPGIEPGTHGFSVRCSTN